MNPALKHFVERAFVGSGVARFASRRLRDRTLVLAYHNIVPDGKRASGDSSLHLSQREFARQLDVLGNLHDVVPIDALLRHWLTAQRPRVVITFDDAYAGALTAGLEELTKRGMPATIFVAPALLGSVPWWDALANPAQGAVPDHVRRHAIEGLHGDERAILGWAQVSSPASRSGSTLPRIATERELADIASRPGITLASHSWAHQNLSTLTGAELESELLRPLEWLRSRFPAVAPWLSYPYGLFSETVQKAAANAGYTGAFRIDGGWMAKASQPSYALPRLNIPAGLSVNGFRLRLAGL